MFGQAICSSCRNIFMSSETSKTHNLTNFMDKKGELSAIENDGDFNLMIPIRKSNRKRTKSFKLKEQDEFILKEAKKEVGEESEQVKLELDESDDTNDQFISHSNDDEYAGTLEETKSDVESKVNSSSFLEQIQDEPMDMAESLFVKSKSWGWGPGFCEECGKTVANLSRHIRSFHLKEKNVSCDECGAAFFDKGALNRHMEKHEVQEGKGTLIPCEECGAGFNSKLNVKKHMRHAHKVKRVTIRVEEPQPLGEGPLAIAKKEGSDEFTIHSAAEAHVANEYKGSKPPVKDIDFLKVVFPDGVCPFCDSGFKQMFYLSLHLKLKHAFCWYQCPSCNIWRNRPCDIATHCTEVHGDTELEVLCPCCKLHINAKNIEDHSPRCFLFKYRRPIYSSHSSFKCRLCSKVMPSRMIYEKHLRSSHNDEIFKCSVRGCNYTSIPDLKLINRHLSSHEKSTSENINSSEPVICDICGRTFPQRGILLNHMKMEHNAISEAQATFPCPECDAVLGSRTMHQAHLDSVHLKLIYDCDKCDKMFETKHSLSQHEKKVHNREMRRVQCHICSEWSANKEVLDNHVRSNHSGERPFACSFCHERFPSLSLMGSHRKRNHPDSWREEKKRRRWLVENKADPSGYKMQCHLCDQTRGTIDELRAHWTADHPGKTDITYPIDKIPIMSREAGSGTCEICGQIFDTQFGLRLHYRKMHLDFNAASTCELCGENFDSQVGLRMHMTRMHQEKNESYKCSVCGDILNSFSRLTEHKQLVHQMEPPPCMRRTHVCDICGKNGMTSIRLRIHMKTHDANRPKKCTYCDKEFDSYANMTRHRKIAHAERWKLDKENLFAQEVGQKSLSRIKHGNYQKKWYEKNRARVRELERERARAKRTGEKYVIPPRQKMI